MSKTTAGGSNPLQNTPPIILIGLMGSGKSTVGRLLSMDTGLPLLDTDTIIEEQLGMSIRTIFRTRGEYHFRLLETALLRYLAGKHAGSVRPGIISTGGGIVLAEENRKILRKLGFCVWLDADVPTLLERTSHNACRPLLQVPAEKRAATLEHLLNERRKFYRETCHLRIDSSLLNANEVSGLISARVRDAR